jgi:gliding motility-associated protein GldC
MRQSQIRFNIELDEENLPEKIFWEATESPSGKLEEAKAINLSIWDSQNKETLRIDLWVKDMQVDEMKRFVVDSIGGMAESIRTSTGDEFMANEMEHLCTLLVKHIKEQHGQK